MTEVVLMHIYATDCYKYGSLRDIYWRTSKTEIISLIHLLIGPLTLGFNSDLFYVTSERAAGRARVISHDA